MYAISTAAFVSVLALASSLAVIVQATGPRAECSETFDVLPGDTCKSIGAEFNLTDAEIDSINSPNTCSGTLPETLCIKTTTPNCTQSEPATSTSCDGMASDWSVTPILFSMYNDDVNLDANNDCITKLVVGQSYCVAV